MRLFGEIGAIVGTEYAANYHIENGAVTMIHTIPHTAAGRQFRLCAHLVPENHLGNNRVLADGNGNAVAVHDYDPYGEEIAVVTGDLYPLPPGGTESPYKYGGKEWNATTSTYDFEARYLSPSFHRFTTMDPLCEKYYSVSPYAYCANNPVNLVDPEGMNSYKVNRKGYISEIDDEGGDKTDYLYGVDDNGNVDKRNGVTLSDTSIMSTLLEKQKKKEKAKNNPENNGVINSISTNALAVMTAFLFLADNTAVEWAVHKSDKGEYAIGTKHDENGSGRPYIDYGLENVVATVHSHPGNQYTNKRLAIESMGYRNDGITDGDYSNLTIDYKEDGKIDRINHVYFPATHNLYRVTLYQPTFIKQISTPKSLFIRVLS